MESPQKIKNRTTIQSRNPTSGYFSEEDKNIDSKRYMHPCVHSSTIYHSQGDFPGGPVVKNPPSNAADAGSIPGWGTRIPHAVGQLSLRTTTREPMCCNYRAHTPGAHAP